MTLRHLCFGIFAALVLSACKVQVTVPTSGSVTTVSGAIDCAAGQVCDVDVTDIYFDETFVAQPAPGFEFIGWKETHRGFCGGNTTPCRLNTAGFEGNETLTAILEDPQQEFYLEPAFRSTGFKSLFMGHSFFRPFAEAMPFHAAQAGIPNHEQTVVFAGGSNGAPEALWDNTEKRVQIQAVLDAGDIDLFVMTYHPDYPGLRGYRLWLDYALAQNPDTRFVVALPWAFQPGQTPTAQYASDWHTGHASVIHPGIDILRGQYPGTDIFCIPYGHAAIRLRELFDAGQLDDVDFLASGSGDAIFSDTFGHADDILVDLGSLVWLQALYGVDLDSYAWDPGYNTDLKAIAAEIMQAHDADFDAPYH
ncbi:MAG: hypothetical protein CME59_10865 [Halioglobus sp.]|nr:hypothetical protein [Halioglobus sp.]|tara:strand:- start:1128 stop:2219 length:1092 start_codon:yes stop_codon:yes gene_type:complete